LQSVQKYQDYRSFEWIKLVVLNIDLEMFGRIDDVHDDVAADRAELQVVVLAAVHHTRTSRVENATGFEPSAMIQADDFWLLAEADRQADSRHIRILCAFLGNGRVTWVGRKWVVVRRNKVLDTLRNHLCKGVRSRAHRVRCYTRHV